MKNSISFVTLVLLVVCMGTATGDVITFSYTATEDGGSGIVTGTFGYDNSVPDSQPSSSQGTYVGAGFWTGTVTGGPQDGATFNLSGLRVDIFDNVGLDQLLTGLSRTFFVLTDTSQNVFDNDSLPGTLDIADFDVVPLKLDGPDIGLGGGQIDYTFQSISSIPEPGSLGILGLMALGSLVLARGRRNQLPLRS